MLEIFIQCHSVHHICNCEITSLRVIYKITKSQSVKMLRRLTKHLKYAVVCFPVDDSVSRIATKDVVMVEGGGEMKEKSKVFVLVKRERYLAYEIREICRAISSAFYNISQPNFVILLILRCSF